ncbi:RBR-type E3 ubiquitin transferase [Balamuthia mandrillaris]
MFRLIRKDKDKGKEKEDEGIGESSGSPRAKRSSTHMKNAREKGKERGAGSSRIQEGEADSENSDVEKPKGKKQDLTLSTLLNIRDAATEEPMTPYNEFANEISKTVMVRNLPFELTAMELADVATAKGGIRMIKFYPKGGLKSALIEFNTCEGLHRKIARKIEALGSGIVVEPARICIRQALTLELENEVSRANDFESKLKEAQQREKELQAELEEQQSQIETMTAEKKRLTNSLNIETSSRHIFEQQNKMLEAERDRLKEENKVQKAELIQLQKQFNRTQFQLLTLQAERNPTDKSISEELQKHLEREMRELQLEEEREQRRYALEKRVKDRMIRQRVRAEGLALSAAQHWKEWARKKAILRQEEELTMKFLEEERLERQREAEEREYSCPICYCDYKIAEMYTLDQCFHRFCFECIGQYLKVKIEEGQVRKIICPDPKCSETITPAEIKHCVSQELFEKFEEFSLQAALNQMPDLRWCPKPGCKNAMIGDEENPMMICSNPSCKYSFCFKCKEEWHADATCEQYQQWKIENSEADAKYAEWVRTNAKPCPKCHCSIEKNGGCNHMTCQQCSHQFCWLCMKDYTSDHFGNMPWSCKQFT